MTYIKLSQHKLWMWTDYSSTLTILTTCLDFKCKCGNIKVGVSAKLQKGNLPINACQMNKGFES